SGFTTRTHWSFILQAAEPVVSCVLFASAAWSVRFSATNGQEVVATGRVEFFAKQGRAQFYVEKMEPVGAGALDLEFRRLCDDLRAKGWFEAGRKRPLPTFPRRIAVVTSRTSAALQDVLNTVRRRCPAVEVALIDVRVQGEGSAAEIARAVRWVSARHAEIGADAVLLTRGGGSMEDLWAFNDPGLAEAVVRCAVPVVAAIGHETDTTIAELVADERCATPTQAAMRLTPDSSALREQIDRASQRLTAMTARLGRDMRRRLEALARSGCIAHPEQLIERARDHVDGTSRHLARAVAAAMHTRTIRVERVSGALDAHRPGDVLARRAAGVERAEARLRAAMSGVMRGSRVESLAQRLSRAGAVLTARTAAELDAMDRALDLVGPVSVLRRGYSMTLAPGGEAVKSAAAVRPGMEVRTLVADGSFTSIVGGSSSRGPVSESAAAQATARLESRAPRSRRGKQEPPDQMHLFGKS
ncbi:MAG: exodeoxyribonuclease VII large subunit, partial [Phycisphaerales bacterium]